jgi:hypothetical protein
LQCSGAFVFFSVMIGIDHYWNLVICQVVMVTSMTIQLVVCCEMQSCLKLELVQVKLDDLLSAVASTLNIDDSNYYYYYYVIRTAGCKNLVHDVNNALYKLNT